MFGLAQSQTLFGGFNGVVHRVADHVHERVSNGFVDGLIHFGIAALGDEIHFLIQLLAHIPDDAVHLLEYAEMCIRDSLNAVVLSFNEIDSDVKIQALGNISLS